MARQKEPEEFELMLAPEEQNKEKLKLTHDVLYRDTSDGPVYIEKKVLFGKPKVEEDHAVVRLRQNVLLASSVTMSFCVPFLIGTPQVLVGTIVNCLLISASGLEGRKLLPFITLPSLAVLSRGLLFGPFTLFLIPMVPLIWAGNALFVYTFRASRTMKRFGLPIGVGAAASVKTAFLATTSMLMASVGLFPVAMLPSMGPLQLITALLGGGLAAGLLGAWRRKKLMAARKKTKFFYIHLEQRE
jgi:hypothetical protein